MRNLRSSNIALIFRQYQASRLKIGSSQKGKLSKWWICWMYLVWVYGLLHIMFTGLVEAMTIFERVFVLLCYWHMYMHLYMSINLHLTANQHPVTWIADFKQALTNHKAITKIEDFSQMYWIVSLLADYCFVKHTRRKADTLCCVIAWQHLISSSI